MLRRTLFTAAVLALAGCATAPARTASGNPEIVISIKDARPIRANVIARNASVGWALEQETESTLFFTRNDTNGSVRSAATQVLLGNAYSTPPKYEVRYTFVPVPEGVRVIVNVAVSTQIPGGQVNHMNLGDTAATFDAFQAQLVRVKGEVESGKAGS